MPKDTLGNWASLLLDLAQFTLLRLHNPKIDAASCAWVRSRYMHEV